jgi:hypothetical protein
MRGARFRSFLAAFALGAFAVGCELLVQLDRSEADAGGDAGCPICSDAGPEDAPADASPPVATDARAEASPRDSGPKGGG